MTIAKKSTSITLFLAMLLFVSFWHSVANAEMEMSLDDVKIDKNSIEEGIKLLEASGQLSPEQAKQARDELAKKSDGEIEALKMQAVERVKSGNIPKLDSIPTGPLPASIDSKAPAIVVPTAAPVVPVAQPAAQIQDSTDSKLKEALNFIEK